jgi:hypothetical protein
MLTAFGHVQMAEARVSSRPAALVPLVLLIAATLSVRRLYLRRVGSEVLIDWSAGDGHSLAVRLATRLLGRHPGPLHHLCPTCGSIEHGRPSFDAPVAVSVAHAPGTSLVAVGTVAALGVDLEPAGVADATWVRREALGKAHGVGILSDPGTTGAALVDLEVPGHVAALAVLGADAPVIRMQPATAAAPPGPATR